MSGAGILTGELLADAERRQRQRTMTTGQLRAFRRLNDLKRLVTWWHDNGVVIEDKAVGLAILIADAMAVVRDRACRRYRELDYETFTYRASIIGVELPEDVVMAALHAVADRLDRLDPDGPDFELHSNLAAGRLLNLSHIERVGAEAWTIAAVDVTRAEAKALAKERRRVLARERDRRRRKAVGATPRSESASRTKPWEAAGLSRATYYRRGMHRAGETVAPQAETTCETNSPASLFLRKEEAGKTVSPVSRPVSAPSEARPRRAPHGRTGISHRGRPFSQTKPWRAFGVSRATWYRHGRLIPIYPQAREAINE